jgi:hypothetical protein
LIADILIYVLIVGTAVQDSNLESSEECRKVGNIEGEATA